MKIQVVGTSGAGKSTFADEVAEALGYPRLEIDALYFEKDWKVRPEADFHADLTRALGQKNWVACGNYFSAKAGLYERADTVVWIHPPFYKILWRVLCRTLRHIRTKKLICNGNVETIRRQFFSKDSIFVWVLRTHARRVKKYRALSSVPNSDQKWIIVKSEADRQRALATLIKNNKGKQE